MAQFRVVCTTRNNPSDPESGIMTLGTDDIPSGGRRYWTRDQVVQAIDQGAQEFFTLCNSDWAELETVHTGYSSWVQTRADAQWCNNLLSLPPCGS